MSFAAPGYLLLAIGLIPLGIFLAWAVGRRRQMLRRFADEAVLPSIVPFYRKDRPLARAGLLLSALFFLVIALARPERVQTLGGEVYNGSDILFALDVSRSMLVRDMPGGRLASAQRELGAFAQKLSRDRLGLIAFAGKAFQQCPLTADMHGFLIALDSVDPASIPRGGTSFEAALTVAVRSFEQAGVTDRTLVIISDGGATVGDTQRVIAAAQAAGIIVHCVGVGTAAGGTIPVGNKDGTETVVTDRDGKPVVSALEEESLRAIAGGTGGMYLSATPRDFGLERLYRERLKQITRHRTLRERGTVSTEWYPVPLTVALLFLLIEYALRGINED